MKKTSDHGQHPDGDGQDLPELPGADGQDVAEEKAEDIDVVGPGEVEKDQAQGHGGREKDADGGVFLHRGVGLGPLDEQGHHQGEADAGPQGIDPHQEPQGDAAEGRVGDADADEGHAPEDHEGGEHAAQEADQQPRHQGPLEKSQGEQVNHHGFSPPGGGFRRGRGIPPSSRRRSPGPGGRWAGADGRESAG